MRIISFSTTNFKILMNHHHQDPLAKGTNNLRVVIATLTQILSFRHSLSYCVKFMWGPFPKRLDLREFHPNEKVSVGNKVLERVLLLASTLHNFIYSY